MIISMRAMNFRPLMSLFVDYVFFSFLCMYPLAVIAEVGVTARQFVLLLLCAQNVVSRSRGSMNPRRHLSD